MSLRLLVDRFVAASGMTEPEAWRILGETGILEIATTVEKYQGQVAALERLRTSARERKQRSRSAGGLVDETTLEPGEEAPAKEKRKRTVYMSTRPAITAEFYDNLLDTLSGQGLTPKLLDDILDESEAVFQSRKTARTLAGLRKWTVHFVTNKISKLRTTYGKN
ncbi:MAG TPA: hypothetical protein VNA25_19560 [Phycisphaerae bacterium]|nr:hypothetical protein [Phycisphaerae bacterium]